MMVFTRCGVCAPPPFQVSAIAIPGEPKDTDLRGPSEPVPCMASLLSAPTRGG
jgi:hypothetical protein